MQVVLRSSRGAALHHLVPLEPFSTPSIVLTVVPRPRRPRHEVAALLLGDVRLRAVDRLDVLSEGARIRVALCTSGDLADVRFLWIEDARRSLTLLLTFTHPAFIFEQPLVQNPDAYLIGVCPVLVFGSVRGIGEGFVAALVLTDVRFLSGVRPQMSLEVLQPGVGLGAALELQTKTDQMPSP